MSDLSTVDDPSKQWEYRGFDCTLYNLHDELIVGFVLVGDEWMKVFEGAQAFAVQSVEDAVDDVIDAAIDEVTETDVTNIEWGDGPDPIIDPEPNVDPVYPNPFPDPKPPRNPWDDGTIF